MSLLLHGSLIVACVIAVFPVFWILISSFKPQQEIEGSITLSILPHHWQISNYTHVLTDDNHIFLDLVLELDHGRVLHDGDRRLPRGDSRVRLLAVPLPRLPAGADRRS